MKTISIINQKGGVAKTTTALALSFGLADKGNRVLAIDLDPQGNLSDSVQITDPAPEDLYSLMLLPDQNPETRISKAEDMDIIISDPQLFDIDIKMTETGKEFRLKEALSKLNGRYDYVIIDTPPSLNLLTVNALTGADEVIIPAQADKYSLTGINGLLNTITAVKKYTNPALRLSGILLTRYNPRTVLSQQIHDHLKEQATALDTKVFNIKIRECIAIKEAQLTRRSIFKFAPKSNASSDYMAFIDEYMNQ